MNIKKMAEKLEIEEDEYLELVKLFIKTSITDIEELEAAVNEGESMKTAQAAHSIKGAAGSLGFTEVYETAKKIEMEAREGNLRRISSDILSLKEQLRTIVSLQGFDIRLS